MNTPTTPGLPDDPRDALGPATGGAGALLAQLTDFLDRVELEDGPAAVRRVRDHFMRLLAGAADDDPARDEEDVAWTSRPDGWSNPGRAARGPVRPAPTGVSEAWEADGGERRDLALVCHDCLVAAAQDGAALGGSTNEVLEYIQDAHGLTGGILARDELRQALGAAWLTFDYVLEWIDRYVGLDDLDPGARQVFAAAFVEAALPEAEVSR